MKATQKDLFRWADQIPEESWTDLANCSPHQAAEAVGAVWEGGAFRVPLLGAQYSIDPGKRTISIAHKADHRVSYQAGVLLLTTLAFSKGVPPSGRMVVPQELPGGRMFFVGAHAVPTGPLAKYFDRDADRVLDRLREIGGETIPGADVALRVPGLPYVPLYVLYWRGDQEVPSRAVIGIDDRAHFHLDLAGVLALTNMLVFEVCKVS